MAINIPIITEFSDAGLQSARGAFDNFKSKIGEADGAMGKLKAGSGAAFDAIKANAGAMALGAGAAIGTFALKAIGDFQNLALEVDKFSNVTGLAAEEASKWVEVAGDMGIESSAVESAINKMNREIGKSTDKFEALGIEVVRTSDGAVDVNETFLNTIDVLKNIQDPAERAKVSAELLGKGWGEVSELVEKGADNLRRSLEDVSDAKLINEDEIRKAKELREAQDRLKDALEDVTLQIGEALVPALSDAANALAPVLDMIGPLAKGFFDGADANASYAEQANKNNVQIRLGTEIIGKLVDWLGFSNEKTEEAADVTDEMAAAWKGGYDAMRLAQTATEDLDRALLDLDARMKTLLGKVAERESWRNLQDRLNEADLRIAQVFGVNTPQAMRIAEEAIDDQILAMLEYVTFMKEEIPDFKETKIIALIEEGQLEEARDLIEDVLGEPIYVDVIPNPLAPGGPKPFSLQTNDSGMKMPGGSNRQVDELTDAMKSQLESGLLATGGRREGDTIIVNVGGSVVSSKDLIEEVRKGLVDAQRNGSGLIYSNT